MTFMRTEKRRRLKELVDRTMPLLEGVLWIAWCLLVGYYLGVSLAWVIR